jgi:hypothetical protein
MLFAEQTELVLVDNAEFDVNPERGQVSGAGLVIGAYRDFEITRLVPVDTLFILPPGRITWTDAAFVWDRKVDVARIIFI